MAVAEQMGHDHSGKDMYRYDTETERVDKSKLWDDIPRIIKELKSGTKERYTFTKLAKSMDTHEVYVPRYYWDAKDAEIDQIAASENCQMVSMRNVVENELLSYFDGHGSPAADYKGRGEYPYVRVKDIVNWEIYKDPTARVPEHVYNKMVSVEKRLEEGDVLFVRRGSYRIGSVAIASPYDEECLLTREILVLRINREKESSSAWEGVNPFYLLYMLSHRLVQMQIPNKVLIETTLPNIGDRWLDMRLPMHNNLETRLEIGRKVENAVQSKWLALGVMADLMAEHGGLTT